MARGISSLLSSPAPCTAAPARVTIGHVQLRDVVICPHEKGLVTYPQNNAIVEHDILVPNSTPRRLTELSFTPNSLSALTLPNTSDTLLAAGGQEAELHLSYYSPSPSPSPSRDAFSFRGSARGFGRKQWETTYMMDHRSINNSVLLTSTGLARSHQSSVEPRLFVSNNDRSVKVYDVAVRSGKGEGRPRLVDAGQLKLDVPINHSSISPDGRTLLCVGDSPDVYIHRISGGSRISFSPISTLSLSAYIAYNPIYTFSLSATSTASVPASFSTAFSGDGTKFAIASQEGVVVVWDVRSTKPLKVFQTDKSRSPPTRGNGGASGWLYDGPWDWARGIGRAPGWGVRSVKFSPAGAGREVMTFTEHTSLLHVVDARTFEKEEIVRVPDFDSPPAMHALPARPRSISPPRSTAVSPPTEPNPPPSSRIVLFSGALEDTFRIPTSNPNNSRRRPRLGRRLHSREDVNADDDVDGIVVIPPMGDREVENDVRRLLGRHGLRTRSIHDNRERTHEDGASDLGMHEAGEGVGDEMDVDELESDCFSSYTPSRAPSPVPAAQLGLQSSGPRPTEHLRAGRPGLLSRRESSGPYITRRTSGHMSRRHRRSTQAAPDSDQDLAGTCFDPSGIFVYVASVKGIVEWRVRGAEQRWWTDPSWA
ncbi:hypothetical protein AcW1_008048 [Taiwanofungus camphoratus]|nr:hypothetical protein AcW1_008048 [Antrodia cinnamomea]